MVQLKIFLPIFILLGGLCYVFLNGPFQSPDEYVHFFRAYDISQGNLRATKLSGEHGESPQVGGYLPRSIKASALAVSIGVPFYPEHKIIPELLFAERNRPLNQKKKEFIDYFPSARLPALSYAPQALGIAIGRALGLPPLALFYLARIFNLLVATALISLSIILLNSSGWTLTVLALSPMSLCLFASSSPDALTNAGAFATLSAIFALIKSPDLLSDNRTKIGWYLFLLGIGAAAMMAGKIFFGILLALLLSVLFRSAIQLKVRILVFSLFIVVAYGVISALSWSAAPTLETEDTRLHAAPQEQLSFITNSPDQALQIIANTIAKYYTGWGQEYIGKLGWLDTPLPIGVHILWITLLLLALYIDSSEQPPPQLGNWDLALALLSSASTMLAIIIAVYILFNAPQAPLIAGVQGRYLIPPMLFLFGTLSRTLRHRFYLPNALPWLVLVGLFVVHWCTLNTLLHRYFL